ncbi:MULTISPECIES: ExbD/TolR family protein [Hyphobacterium]|uniref:ExbD/TolR family protein n=1 Tax=Hyphobacterium vulgare TaxID=1736751 RepID=A0ABV6ZUZ1_9PROT
MRRRKNRANDQAEVNMTPMLDIVFILLIFFIVTATFLQEEGLNMQPPPQSPETPPDPAPVILVDVNDQGRVFVNQQQTDPERVLAAVSRFRAENPRSAVLIAPQYQADHGIVVLIWDDMQANGIPVSVQPAERVQQ